MGVAYNSAIVSNGLVFALDVANRKCISPLGCTGFNNAPQLVKNLVSRSDTIDSYNGVKLGNLSYYTVFAIDYPEGSFGGSAAGRDGITPGYNVTSGTKTFDFGRALNYAVYNNPTQSWVKTTVYDSYVGTAAVNTFVSEYATAVATYPDAIHIVAGSHRDSYHTAAQYAILRDLGAPSNVDSIIGFSSPEWILVGKPGLGAGNAYGWVFQNYTTDPTRVAHLNFGLPIYGGTGNYLEFDGTDDYIQLPNSLGYSTEVSAFAWFRSTGSPVGGYHIIYGGQELEISIPTSGEIRTGVVTNARYVSNHGSGLVDGNWHQVGFTFSGTTKTSYIDGVSVGTQTTAGALTSSFSNRTMGRFGNSTAYYLNGDISIAQIYNRALTAAEIQQNFNATRSRFGI
jgi:hypothetical protein